MDLNESLSRFRLQQERCHASLSTIAAAKTPPAAAAAATKPQHWHPAAAPRPPARPTAPAVRFSDDTARLQKMHAVRHSAVGSQIKDVIELLYRVINQPAIQLDSA